MHNLRFGSADMHFPMLLITGARRSGTGITGRILGSCQDTIFAYEPPWLEAIAGLLACGELSDAAAKFLLEVCIHDDEFYPQIIGRRVNLRPGYSNSLNYMGWDELVRRLALPDRRRDYDRVPGRGLWTFVTKMPDLHLVLDRLLALFPQLRIIHLVRDGRMVVRSGLKRAWYTDEFYQDWIVTWFREDADGTVPLPWFVEEQYRASWEKWSPASRAAYSWTRIVRHGLEVSRRYPDRALTVKYEALASDPTGVAKDLATWANLTLSELSALHVRKLIGYDQVAHQEELEIASDIEEEFLAVLKLAGYEAGR